LDKRKTMSGNVVTLTTRQLAEALGAELHGPGEVAISSIAPIELAASGQLTFIRSEKYARMWLASSASAVVMPRKGLMWLGAASASSVAADATDAPRALLIVKDADLALARCVELLHPDAVGLDAPVGVSRSAHVHPAAHVDATASIGPHCTIGPGARIGARTVLHANVVVLDRCEIGADCMLSPGVVIGAEGFSYRPDGQPSEPGSMRLVKLPHVGHVIIGDNVDIGSNTCIDRGRLGPTVIGDGTKIDNLVQIGHNCRIGKHCVICGKVGLAGSVTLGDWAQIGGGASVADNINIGPGARVAACSAVMNDIPARETWAGLPAMQGREYLRAMASLKKLATGGPNDGPNGGPSSPDSDR